MDKYKIDGNPIPWKRAGRNGRFTYDPQLKEKMAYRNMLASAEKTVSCSSKPLSLVYQFNMPIPKSWSRTRRLNAIGKPHTSKPDKDNLEKFINDTFNKILWEDDAQIFTSTSEKIYAEKPSTIFIVVEWEDE